MRKSKKQDKVGVTTEELREFANSLNEERKFFPRLTERILSYDVTVGEKIDNVVAGVAGINRILGLPNLSIVVRLQFQGKGIGDKLMAKLHKIAEAKYDLITLKVWKENVQAVMLFRKWGYRVFAENCGAYFMLHPMNLRGTIIYYILRGLCSIGGSLVIWLARNLRLVLLRLYSMKRLADKTSKR